VAFVEVKVRGIKELIEAFGKASEELRGPAARRALGQAANLISKNARQQVRSRSGNLRRAIVARYSRRRSDPTKQQVALVRIIGGRGGRTNRKGQNVDGYYAPWVEKGHRIIPKRQSYTYAGIALKRGTLKAARQRAGNARRTRAVQFLENAYRGTRGIALQKIIDVMSQELTARTKK
jgi:HK97 gp10 family phage protein